MIRETGWTWEYIDEHMTLPRLYAFNAAWDECPPLYRLAAAWFGYKSKKNEKIKQPTEDDAMAGAYMMGEGRPIDDSEGPDGFE